MTRAPVLVVDARSPFGSGLGRYLRESVVALSRLDRFHEIVLVGPADELGAVVTRMSGRVRVLDAPRPRYDLWFPRTWDARLREADVGVNALTWFPHWDGAWVGPWQAPGASRVLAPVTTLHDLIPLRGTGLAGRAKARVAEAWMRRMVAASRVLVTGSAHTRAQIAERFPGAADTLRVIPHGVAEVFTARLSEAGAPSARAGGGPEAGGPPYLLCVANKKPHKRLEVAIETLAHLGATHPTLRLVLIGERFDHGARLRAVAERCGVAARVDDLTDVPDAALVEWYAGASAVLVPSREEGFGMVALEAMACGAPVVAVAHPPIPEVVGSAAVLVPPAGDAAEAAAIAEAIRRLVADPVWRLERVAAGRVQAARHTWAQSAQALADALLFPVEPR